MPVSHSSPARVPNFSYNTGPRDLNLLDSVVQKDMARTKRISGTAVGSTSRPYALDSQVDRMPVKSMRKVVVPKESKTWDVPVATTKRSNHLQNAPSLVRDEVRKPVSRVNCDSDPMMRQAKGSSADPKPRSRINEDSNIFGPAKSPFSRAPPVSKEPFVERRTGGHIRPTLHGMTDAYKFAEKSRGSYGISTRPF
eukprot:TRINITY_DN508_c2_g1_i1.p1 TRINITY_DN508_c2_g1~~TRINITY_DN508_c2_g1_i1.p1  ORF type:complete len:196 (+),score=23.54 TRINITY_DN508_c2_g1_i1:58-645(+)